MVFPLPWRINGSSSGVRTNLEEESSMPKNSSETTASVSPSEPITSAIASFSRTMLIQKIVLLPKFKAAAFFQPEDHIRKDYVRRSSEHGRVLSRTNLTRLAQGGIFASGCFLFLGHDLGLHLLHHGNHVNVDNAPAISSALAGCLGGFLYAVTSTPIASYLAGDMLSIQLFKGLKYTLARDVGGFGVYFGTYTFLRHIGHDLFEDDTTSANTSSSSDIQLSVLEHLPRTIALSAAAGGGAGLTTYIWRSPFDTLFKISRGWRPKDTPLFSAQRFMLSPRGVKAVYIGALTWGMYEGSWALLEEMARAGKNQNL